MIYFIFPIMCICVCLCRRKHCVQVPTEFRRGYRIPWRWSHRWLWATWHECWEQNLSLFISATVVINFKTENIIWGLEDGSATKALAMQAWPPEFWSPAWGTVDPVWNLSTGRQRQTDLWKSLVSQFSWVIELRVQRKSKSQKSKVESNLGRQLTLTYGFCMQVHVYTHTNT